jgi:hypothetical protein
VTPLPYILIGNPENRRVTLFQEALAARGQPPATVVAWADLLQDPNVLDRLPDRPALVRVDSTGENFAVEKLLLARGFADAQAAGVSTVSPAALAALPYQHGRILPPRQYQLGFSRALGELEAIFAAHPRWIVLNAPASIAELFDKRITSRRYAQAGVPVPRPLEGIDSYDALVAEARRLGLRSVFVKFASGSSASCLAVYQSGPEHEYVMTTVEDTGEARYNSLRLRRINDLRRIARLIEFLLREGSQVEEGVPKARLDGRFFDCRVLVIDGAPAFTVVRTSSHPITNLHLGGRRGDVGALERLAPAEAIAAAMESCRRVWQAHDSFHVGVDLMYEPGYRGHRVLEANAFGDLLPNLERDGLSVYEWQITRAQEKYCGLHSSDGRSIE